MSIFVAYLSLLFTSALASLVTSAIFGGNFGLNKQYLKLVSSVLETTKTQIKDEADDDDDDDDDNKTDDTVSQQASSPPPSHQNSSNQLNQHHIVHSNHSNQTIRLHPPSPPSSPPLLRKDSIPNKCLSPDAPPIFLLGDSCDSQHEFQLDDAFTLIQKGITAIIDDQVTKCFNTEELHSWNLLTRTNIKHYHVTLYLALSWFFGFIIRYLFLLPIRIICLTLGILWLISVMAIVGCIPEPIKSKVYWHTCLMSFRMLSCSITATLEFHNCEFRPQKGDICVANHTSPIDVVMLACDNCYALVGQRHNGFLGMLQRALSRAANHVWFERSEMRDRQLVVQRLIEHVSASHSSSEILSPSSSSSSSSSSPSSSSNRMNNNNNITSNNNNNSFNNSIHNQQLHQHSNNDDNSKPTMKNLPILIFPEGTCINNSAVMMFKKGSFEASDKVCPVAIKYDLRFGDPFWNSSQQGYVQYLLMMMSSWAIKCDIWYLPPMTRLQNESSAEFANRVKHEIAQQSGLVELAWDGQLKRTAAKVEWKYKQQEDFARRLKLE